MFTYVDLVLVFVLDAHFAECKVDDKSDAEYHLRGLIIWPINMINADTKSCLLN